MKPEPWRVWLHIRAQIIIHALPYLLVVLAAALFALAFAQADNPRTAPLPPLAVVNAVIAGLIFLDRSLKRATLVSEATILASIKRLEAKVVSITDDVMMLSAAGAAGAFDAYLGPDSIWRLNLIKEVRDGLDADVDTTLAAIEGSVLDLAERFGDLKRDVDKIRHNGRIGGEGGGRA